MSHYLLYLIYLFIIQNMISYHIPYAKVTPLVPSYHKRFIFSRVKCHWENSMWNKFSNVTLFDFQASQALFIAENKKKLIFTLKSSGSNFLCQPNVIQLKIWKCLTCTSSISRRFSFTVASLSELSKHTRLIMSLCRPTFIGDVLFNGINIIDVSPVPSPCLVFWRGFQYHYIAAIIIINISI